MANSRKDAGVSKGDYPLLEVFCIKSTKKAKVWTGRSSHADPVIPCDNDVVPFYGVSHFFVETPGSGGKTRARVSRFFQTSFLRSLTFID